MNYADQDQLAAEQGMALPDNPARDEAMDRHGYDPLPDFLQQAQQTCPTVHPTIAPVLQILSGGVH